MGAATKKDTREKNNKEAENEVLTIQLTKAVDLLANTDKKVEKFKLYLVNKK